MIPETNTTVQKALSPEEAAELQNVIAALQQLVGAASSGDAEVMVEEAATQMPEEDPNVAKADMGPTANPEDRAEDRVEQPTEITEGNLSEVGKSLKALVTSVNASVAKDSRNGLVMKALAEITEVMKTMSQRQAETDLAITNILDGMKLADTVSEVNKSQGSQNNKPASTVDAGLIVKELAEVLSQVKKSQEAPQVNTWGGVQKTQRENLAAAGPHLLRGGGF